MKKFVILFFSLCFIAALLIISGAVERDSSLLGNKEKVDNTVYIGMYEPQTGDDAKGAMREILGFKYANSVCPTVDINGVTYNIKLVEADNMSKKDGAESSAQALVKANVTAVLGSYDSENTAFGLPFFQKASIPVIGVSCTSSLISPNEGFFRLCYTDSFQSGVLANCAYNMEYRKAAVLTQTADIYSKEAGKLFSKEFTRLGGEVFDFSFQSGQENFKSLSEEIRDSDADVIIMMSGPSEAKYFIKQSRKYGLNLPIMGPENWDSGLLLADATVYSKNVYIASEFDGSSKTDPVSAEFAKRFSSWVSNDSDLIEANGGCDYASSSSALAYDAYMLLIDAIKTSNSNDSQAVMEAIKTISYEGVTGNISFKNGESGKSTAFIKSIDERYKQFEVLQTISAGK